ncbi:MAG: response regulator, partial [Desulfobacula sp.]|uniref:response regulator n=1 Tax=Desulfobacula sp. TaxID=2593537 RepID=UPI0025C1C908
MKKYKILLVDDDITLVQGTSLYLEQKGYHVFTAGNGKAAIDLLQISSFDLVLTDLVMPGIDGFQVLKKAKTLQPEIMVIVMTGFGDVKFAIDCLRLGADDYMLKPCEPEEMVFRIKNCLEKLEGKKQLKNAENALRDSEKLYRSLIETTGTGYVIIDESGKIKDANKESLRLIG